MWQFLQQLSPVGVLGAIFLFGFAVFIHELGHFLVAKWAGVGVKRFAIGFGPIIVAVVRGGTEYSLRWIPLGGFVQLKGMIIEEEEEEAPAGEQPAPPPGEPASTQPAQAEPAAAGETAPSRPEARTTTPEARTTTADAPSPGSSIPSIATAAEHSPDSALASATATAAAKRSAGVTEDLDALRNQHPLVRLAVFLAGVTCNYLTAIVFYAIFLIYGQPRVADLPNFVERVPEASQWYELGWRSGDRIVAVERAPSAMLEPLLGGAGATGRPTPARQEDITDWVGVKEAVNAHLPAPPRFQSVAWLKRKLGLAPQQPHEPARLRASVERDGRRLELPLPEALLSDPEEGEWFLPPQPAHVKMVMPASGADRARLVKMDYTPNEEIRPFPTVDQMSSMPLRQGDTILEVNHTPVATWREMRDQLLARPDEAIYLTVRRNIDGQPRTLLLAANLESSSERPGQGQLGVIPGLPEIPGERDRTPVLRAIVEAPIGTLMLTDRLVSETVRFFATHSGRDIKRNLGGPAAIVKLAYDSAQRGLSDYLWIFILISVVLAVMNVLPIPVLDGGYIFITLVEMVIGRPIPSRVLAPILTTFMVLLMMAFIWLFWNDFMNLVMKM